MGRREEGKKKGERYVRRKDKRRGKEGKSNQSQIFFLIQNNEIRVQKIISLKGQL